MPRTEPDQYDSWLASLTLDQIENTLRDLGAGEVLVRRLTDRQGNDKQQIYCGQDLTATAKIPSGELVSGVTTSRKPGASGKVRYQAGVDLWWIAPGFVPVPAPGARLIYYPQYPEVRLSGFLRGSPDPPVSLLAIGRRGREMNRVLLLAPVGQRVYGLVLPPESAAGRQLLGGMLGEAYGPFHMWQLAPHGPADTRSALLARLCEIAFEPGWLPPRLLGRDGVLRPCRGTNCGGFTLEAAVGVAPNAVAEPDYLGWELKAHKVSSLTRPAALNAGVLTLMTPEPDGGLYAEDFQRFVMSNGYQNSPDRWDFGGIMRVGHPPRPRTGASIRLQGYQGGSSFTADGAIQLVGRDGSIAASWSYAKILNHWRTKHQQTAYVPYVQNSPEGFRYGATVRLGVGTTFPLLLQALAAGEVYYDPGINLKLQADGRWRGRRRSQFRSASRDLGRLYRSFETVETHLEPPGATGADPVRKRPQLRAGTDRAFPDDTDAPPTLF